MIKIKSNNEAPAGTEDKVNKLLMIVKTLSKLAHHHHGCGDVCYCGLTKIRKEIDELTSKF